MKISFTSFSTTGGWPAGSFFTEDEAYILPGGQLGYRINVVSGDFVIAKVTGEDMPPHFGVVDPSRPQPFNAISTGLWLSNMSEPEPVLGFEDYFKSVVLEASDNSWIILYAFTNEPPRLYSDAVYFNEMPAGKISWGIPALIGVAIVGAFIVVGSKRSR